MGTVFPKDGGATFRGDDGVVGVFENEYPVGHCDAERTSGTTFANDDGDDGDGDFRHVPDVDGDGFGDVAFFGFDPGICAWGVDEGDDGHAELFGHFHDAEGFAVAFWVGATEVAKDVFLGIAAFLLADEHDRAAVKFGGSAYDGRVVPEVAVAVDFLEIGKSVLEVVQGIGALGVAGELDFLPGGEVGVDLFDLLLDLLFGRGHLPVEVYIVL